MNIKKKIALITGTEDTRISLHQQIQSYVEGYGEVESFAIDKSLPPFVSADLIVLSTNLIYDEVIKAIDTSKPLVVARRMINYDYIDRILVIPKNKRVLLVNDVPETTYETMDYLIRLGLDHLEYVPFYPGCHLDNEFEIAITPGETHLVPEGIEKIVDIGPRLIDMTSVMEIFRKLEIMDERADALSEKYIRKIIQQAKKLAEFTNEKTSLNQQLISILNSINDALLVVDGQEKIQMINDNMETLLKVSRKKALNRSIRYYIEDSNFLTFILNKTEENSLYINFRNQQLLAQKLLLRDKNLVVITLKNINETLEMERKLKRELLNKGHVAKHNFNSIIGEDEIIHQTKKIAEKLAKSDFTILIEGESGTGKELFASAIHNSSPRKEGPFLAVNFSALPEELVESELFGYEEGSFTGAKKGGKIGLFQQANGGTIFLDEIGDISPKIQTRLLRVLQEKEIMKVGGDRIIPIDVRIIAATNKNLLEMIENNRFREDLYHRLKVLYLHIPPLRERKEDIPLLLSYFLKEEGKRHIKVDPLVVNQLKSYNWYGNVREFKNIISYMIAVSDHNEIHIDHLPDKNFFQTGKKHKENFSISEELTELGKLGSIDEFMKILNEMNLASREGRNIGRYQLMLKLQQEDCYLTQQQIRHRLDLMEGKGYINKGKGRGGSKITIKGKELLREWDLRGDKNNQ